MGEGKTASTLMTEKKAAEKKESTKPATSRGPLRYFTPYF